MKNQKVIIWLHMHQPDYFNPIPKLQYLPWVRRNITKSYYNVAKILSKYQTKININFSGILLKQIITYQNDNFNDYYEILETKNTEDLTESEKTFILEHFLIPGIWKESRRYNELIEKKKCNERFSLQDIRDAQFLFSLSAFSPLIPGIPEMIKKGRYYSETDKSTLRKIEKEVIKSILNLYKSLYEKGQIELTITPFYHPILPLLINTESAKESKNDTIIPEGTFKHPEDAKEQIERSIKTFINAFGKIPQGMWPSEGSISEEAIKIISESGIKWIGTDEQVLKRSIENGNPESLIWNFQNTRIFFRNHNLSDKIGFVYNKMDPGAAADDFYNEVQSKNRTEVVILDGENPWEYYPNSGIDFLNEWFKKIEDISALGSEIESTHKLSHIIPGSWINGYFDTWIGHKESNIAWTYLTEARETMQNSKEAIEEIYIAEGSDWFWWYSDFHKKEVDMSFDTLFRSHLIKAYEVANQPIPEYLHYPIKEVK